MNRKLATVLVSACALAAALTGGASASASTLSLDTLLGDPATVATFADADGYTYVSGMYSYRCEAFTLGTEITQNEADPVTLQAWDGYLPLSIDGCGNGPVSIDFSDVELDGPMTFNADGTGSLPLRLTETWNGPNLTQACTREGVLELTYNPSQYAYPVGFNGDLTEVAGWCPAGATTYWNGSFDAPTDDYGAPIEWVLTP